MKKRYLGLLFMFFSELFYAQNEVVSAYALEEKNYNLLAQQAEQNAFWIAVLGWFVVVLVVVFCAIQYRKMKRNWLKEEINLQLGLQVAKRQGLYNEEHLAIAQNFKNSIIERFHFIVEKIGQLRQEVDNPKAEEKIDELHWFTQKSLIQIQNSTS